MLQVLSCIAHDHDYGLLVLAALVCTAGAWTGIKTFINARNETQEGPRLMWTAMSGVCTAAAIWATHFIAMLAYRPSLQTGWDLGISVASLIIGMASTGLGLVIGSDRRVPLAPELGGIVIGIGMAAMHFVGMAAFEVAGRIVWDHEQAWFAVLLGIGFAALALSRAARPVTRFCRYGANVSLILAICSLHFTGMSAVTIVPDPTIAMEAGAAATGTFGCLVAAVAILIIGASFATYTIDRRTSRAAIERMHKLANATTEGIVIVRDGMIVDANDRFVDLVDVPLGSIIGSTPARFWEDALGGATPDPTEECHCELTTRNGDRVPVRVVASPGGPDERIFAIRDLRTSRAYEARIAHLAHHDALTGLANRASFVEALDAAIASGEHFAIHYIDLDRFKDINDGNGHAAGDAVLVETARRMRAVMPGCTLARLGGDEFAILKHLSGQDAEDGADALSAILKRPLVLDDVPLRLGASIGVSRHPCDGTDQAVLLGNADIAMYAAKAERQSGVRRFEASMGDAVRRRRALSNDLKSAVANGQVEVFYQPQADVQSGRITGFEALVRWHHPRLGTIGPGEFIPLAEENGTIVEIGAWVMHRACEDAAPWPKDLKIAVNLSQAQFSQDVEAMIVSALDRAGLTPHRLEVEITESMLINDPERTLAILSRIKALGPSIAMDDFGTGYSSLSSLQAFPFDKIKIDRSFVDKLERSPQAAAIVRAVVNLGRSLDIPVLAEGVETQIHLDFLKTQGCASAQGYLIGRPTPLAGTLRHIAPYVAAEAA